MSAGVRDRARWRETVRAWLKNKPSGFTFRSRDIYCWAESGAVPLNQDDLKPYSKSSKRPFWRYVLSCALQDLYRAGELAHPGIAGQIWRVP